MVLIRMIIAANKCGERHFFDCFLKVDDEIGGKQANDESNCGDSTVVLCRGKESLALYVDHKPNRKTNMQELKRLEVKAYNGMGIVFLVFLQCQDLLEKLGYLPLEYNHEKIASSGDLLLW
ncbi:abscisic acid insensitivity 1B [Tanacetum coccineum]|uniref:Abscisic acid insensitivity 1B n=1 Tax=Tanacetum coccineum TaxID=301880 RepID=A0ABQ5CII8_9ASTR